MPDSFNQDKIWDYYQTHRAPKFIEATQRLGYLLKSAARLVRRENVTALNIGAGNGWLEQEIARVGWHSCSLDPSDKTIELLRSKGIEGKVGRIEKMPYSNELFDVVFCSEVLEHLSDNDLHEGLSEIYRVLKPGGVLIGTVPYGELLSENNILCPSCGTHFHRWGHQQTFDETSLKRVFPSDLPLVELKVCCFVSWPLLNWRGRVAGSMKKIATSFGARGAGLNLFFVASRNGLGAH